MPQYLIGFLFSGVMFLLFVADLASLAWQKGGPLRVVAAVAGLAIVTGNAISLSHFYTDGRGHRKDAGHPIRFLPGNED